MHYPTVKFFSINTKPGSLGLEIKKKNDAIGLQNDLIKQLEIEQQEGRGSSWPNIVPYRYLKKKNLLYIYIISEFTNCYLFCKFPHL